MVGYFEDGPNLVTMAMNGWADGEPAWWLNLQAHPEVSVDRVLVVARLVLLFRRCVAGPPFSRPTGLPGLPGLPGPLVPRSRRVRPIRPDVPALLAWWTSAGSQQGQTEHGEAHHQTEHGVL